MEAAVVQLLGEPVVLLALAAREEPQGRVVLRAEVEHRGPEGHLVLAELRSPPQSEEGEHLAQQRNWPKPLEPTLQERG